MTPVDEVADAVILRFPAKKEQRPVARWPSVLRAWAAARLLVESAGWLVVLFGLSRLRQRRLAPISRCC